MMILVDDQLVTCERFPNGESRISLADPAFLDAVPSASPRVAWYYEGDDDFWLLTLVASTLRGLGCTPTLDIAYMPYSRMDRQTSDVFSLREASRLINDMHFTTVTVHEPHSDVTPALLDNVTALYPSATWLATAAMDLMGFQPRRDLLLFPDAGAQKRYGDLASTYRYVVGNKHRGHRGKIDGYVFVGAEHLGRDIEGTPIDEQKVLIVDDLCSYGGTFAAAAAALQIHTTVPTTVGLVVTHLEESVYKGSLLTSDDAPIATIVASTSLHPTARHPRVHLYDLLTHQPVAVGVNNNQTTTVATLRS
jgi:ribose-phosphate pyrophosphokinase